MHSVDSRIDIDQRRADTSPVFVLDYVCLYVHMYVCMYICMPSPQLWLIKRPICHDNLYALGETFRYSIN